MKKNIIKIYSFLLLLSLILCSCSVKHTMSNVEELKTLYSNRILRDSIFIRDSVFVKENADTVFITRNRVLYRDRFLTDTLWRNDTVYSIKEIVSKSGNRNSNMIGILLFIVMSVLFMWRSGLLSVLKNLFIRKIL